MFRMQPCLRACPVNPMETDSPAIHVSNRLTNPLAGID